MFMEITLWVCGRLWQTYFSFACFSYQTPAPTRSASFSESWTPNNVTPVKKSRAGLPEGNWLDSLHHSFVLAGLYVYSYFSISFLSSLPPTCPFLSCKCCHFFPSFLFVHHPTLLFFCTPSCIIFVSLRLSQFSIVASEEHGNRQWER